MTSSPVPSPVAPLAAGEVSPIPPLTEVLRAIPDPRSPQGRRHCLVALLGLLLVGFLSGCNTVKAVVIHGRNRRRLRKTLGFTHKKSPSQSTFTRLFSVLPIASVRQPIVDWFELLLIAWARDRKTRAAVDGKTMRGTGDHVLHIFVHDFWCLLDQLEVGEKTNEMAGFRTALPAFLAKYPFLEILTFDALFCEQATMNLLTENNRMGIFQVKDNQPETLRRLERWFARQPKKAPDFRGVEKKRGLRGDAGTLGGQRPRRHRRQDAAGPPDRRASDYQ